LAKMRVRISERSLSSMVFGPLGCGIMGPIVKHVAGDLQGGRG
jgi:hypothetical protein